MVYTHTLRCTRYIGFTLTTYTPIPVDWTPVQVIPIGPVWAHVVVVIYVVVAR